MICFIIFFTSIIHFYIIKENLVKPLFRILRKIIYPKQFEIPNLSQYDFPLPPFPNTWYPICLSKELRKNTLRKEKIAGKEFILYRGNDGIAYAISNKCSHMGVDLVYGHVENDCVVCPFHNKCNKPTQKQDNAVFFIEEVNNIIFIWIGGGKPFRSMADLMKKYTEPEKYMFSFSFLKRTIGGHLVDYAEHLLDINHTQSIHGVDLDPNHTKIELTDHSFSVGFKIEGSGLTPKFTYITPTFGFIEYTEKIKVYIIFIVKNVGCIEMVILPNGNTILQIIYSFLGSLYTQIDFADESAFFTTKSHDTRNLFPNEMLMQNFRNWFKNTFYTTQQIDNFSENKTKYLYRKQINDW